MATAPRALLACLALLLAGCASPAASPSLDPNPSTQAALPSPPVSAPTRQPAKAEPVHITDSGDATMGATKSYSWPVEPGFSSLTVRLAFASPADAPTWAYTGALAYSLVDGAAHEVAAADEQGTGASGDACLLCYSLTPAASGGAALGTWALSFHVDHVPGTYHVDIETRY